MESSIHQSLRLLSLTHHFWFRKITISPILHRFIEWRTFYRPENLSYPDFTPCPLIIEDQFYFIIKWVKWSNYLFFRIFRIFATFYNFTFYMKWRCYSIMLNPNNGRVFMGIWYGVRTDGACGHKLRPGIDFVETRGITGYINGVNFFFFFL